MNDVILIVDQHRRHEEALQRAHKIDPNREAKGLGLSIKPFGRRSQRIAIVSPSDEEGIAAYQKEGFDLRPMNGNRSQELLQFIKQMDETMYKSPPKYLVLVTNDPTFDLLCTSVIRNKQTHVAIWAPGPNIPPEFTQRDYDFRQLDELLPDIKIPKVAVHLDFENLFIGLEKKGWKPNPKALIEAIKASIADLGDIVSIVAYADWDQLSRGSGFNVQRELAIIGVDPRYQVNMNGKNSADMKIADDIRNLVEKGANAPDAVDVIVLGTCDRDFRPTVETAKARGRELLILALEDGISGELRKVAQVRYLDQYLGLPRQTSNSDASPPTASDEHADLAIRIEIWLRRQGWQWAYVDKLSAAISPGSDGAKRLRQAIESKVLVYRQRPGAHTDNRRGPTKALMPNPNHPLVQTVRHLIEWIPSRLTYCLKTRGMDYVDSNFLAKGMTMDQTFRQLGVGQNRMEAEEWLNLAADAGVLVKKSRPHPKRPSKTITTWWLPEERHDQAAILRRLITCVDLYTAGRGYEWMPIKTLHRKLGQSNSGTFQQTLDQMLASGDAWTEKHTRKGHKYPTTGLHLRADGSTISTVRVERGKIIAHLTAMTKENATINVNTLTERVLADETAPQLDAQATQYWWTTLKLEKVLRPPQTGNASWTLGSQHRFLMPENNQKKAETADQELVPRANQVSDPPKEANPDKQTTPGGRQRPIIDNRPRKTIMQSWKPVTTLTSVA